MKIITLPNQLLRQVSEEVELPLSKTDQKIAQELLTYLEEADKDNNNLRPGVGIAAVQLGYLKRIFCARFKINQNSLFLDILVNPKLTFASKKQSAIASGEGCLSIQPDEKTDTQGLVHRSSNIRVEGYSFLRKKMVKYNLEGFAAMVFQHELDHLDGKLFFDRIDQQNPWQEKDNETMI